MLREENEGSVERFLERHHSSATEWSVLDASQVWTQLFGADAWGTVAQGGSDGTFLHVTPAEHRTDGFFAAVIEKKQ